MNIHRCDWANKTELEKTYHDTLWGKPIYDDRELFKMLILEGKQAGLSWLTILSKMQTLCHAFNDFDPKKIKHYDTYKIEQLLSDDGIIKNRLKVNAVVHNANMYFNLCEKYGSLSTFFWSYVSNKPIINHWEKITDIPTKTPLSDEISQQLKQEGFKFVGSTTIYAFMQSVGMVNDHILSCHFRHES